MWNAILLQRAWKSEYRRLRLTLKAETLHVDIKHPIPFFSSVSRVSNCVLCFSFSKVPIRLLWRNCIPTRTREKPEPWRYYQVPVTCQNAMSGDCILHMPELPPESSEPAPHSPWAITEPIQGFWNPPLAPRKGYNTIYFKPWVVWRRWASSILLFHCPED